MYVQKRLPRLLKNATALIQTRPKIYIILSILYLKHIFSKNNAEAVKGFPFYGVTLTYADSAHF